MSTLNSTWLVAVVSVNSEAYMKIVKYTLWASYQISKISGCACAGNERFPRHRLNKKSLVSDPGMHHGTCVTHVSWFMSGSLGCGGGKNVPGIPGACATRSFAYLVRGPLWQHWIQQMSSRFQRNWEIAIRLFLDFYFVYIICMLLTIIIVIAIIVIVVAVLLLHFLLLIIITCSSCIFIILIMMNILLLYDHHNHHHIHHHYYYYDCYYYYDFIFAIIIIIIIMITISSFYCCCIIIIITIFFTIIIIFIIIIVIIILFDILRCMVVGDAVNCSSGVGTCDIHFDFKSVVYSLLARKWHLYHNTKTLMFRCLTHVAT